MVTLSQLAGRESDFEKKKKREKLAWEAQVRQGDTTLIHQIACQPVMIESI